MWTTVTVDLRIRKCEMPQVNKTAESVSSLNRETDSKKGGISYDAERGSIIQHRQKADAD